MASIRRFATLVEAVPREFILERDPKDEPYLNLACRAGASFLVSRDSDLLDLANVPQGPGKLIRQKYPQLTILTPEAFLLAIRKHRSERAG